MKQLLTKHMMTAKLIGAVILSFWGTKAMSQCAFTGLDSIYCVTDFGVEMVPVDGAGVFTGPGVIGDTFYPGLAGEGTHTIYHTTSGGSPGDVYYIKSNIGNPWGSTTNNATMDNAFGA